MSWFSEVKNVYTREVLLIFLLEWNQNKFVKKNSQVSFVVNFFTLVIIPAFGNTLHSDSFCRCQVRTKLNFKSLIQIFQIKFLFFVLSFHKWIAFVYFFKEGSMLYIFESLKWKAKIELENQDCKCLKFGLPWGKFLP